MFTQLHVHSHYSLLDAIGKPKDFIAKAKKLEMSALALTDYSGMYGVIEFYKICTQEHIQPLVGVEIALVQDRTQQEGKQQPGTITLLAKNYEGYLALLKLVSHGNLEGYQRQPSIDRDILKGSTEHLLGFMGGSRSVLGSLILQNEERAKLGDTLSLLKSYFNPGDFYLEYIAQDESKLPQEKKVNTQLLTLAKQTHTAIFAATNVHYVQGEDKEAYEVGMAIKDGKRIYDEDRRKTAGDLSLQSEFEVRAVCKHNGLEDVLIDSLIQTTQDIVEKIDISLPLGTILFPKYDSAEDIKMMYEKVKDELVEE